MKKTLKLLFTGLMNFVIYVLLYCLIISPNGKGGGHNFFAGCVLALICAIIFGCGIWFLLTKEREPAMLLCLIIACSMVNVMFNTFGPTYADRSVSYHMAFYAVDNGELDVDKMKQVYVEQMIDKRVEDELEAGMIKVGDDGKIEATQKAKMIVPILKYIGRVTRTLDEYNDFSVRMKYK